MISSRLKLTGSLFWFCIVFYFDVCFGFYEYQDYFVVIIDVYSMNEWIYFTCMVYVITSTEENRNRI